MVNVNFQPSSIVTIKAKELIRKVEYFFIIIGGGGRGRSCIGRGR